MKWLKSVLIKRCSENMQQIYRRTLMSKCDFNKFVLKLYWNHTSAWVLSCKLAAYFQNTFGGLLLEIKARSWAVSYFYICKLNYHFYCHCTYHLYVSTRTKETREKDTVWILTFLQVNVKLFLYRCEWIFSKIPSISLSWAKSYRMIVSHKSVKLH